jgi:hypothetical protein
MWYVDLERQACEEVKVQTADRRLAASHADDTWFESILLVGSSD